MAVKDDRPAKRVKLLDDVENDSASSEDESADGREGGKSKDGRFTINEEYARRFEHNKKREEQHRLEEKYGKTANKRSRDDAEGEDGEEGDSEDSEDDVSEDEDADLVTEDVDGEIMATLQAIKTKDPRVYDKNVRFYKELDDDAAESLANGDAAQSKQKPIYLHDYHRQNLLAGQTGSDEVEDGDTAPRTYQAEQDAMRKELVGSMHTAAHGGADTEEADPDTPDIFAPKSKSKHEDLPVAQAHQITDADVATADADPETFLSNFMAARAWLPTSASGPQAFDSDDSEEEARADAFEEAYNLRFEDPRTANEKLQSFARDVGKYSVRRDDTKARKKARDREREAKEAAKREREEERARLKKLRVEEAEEKVRRIKEAAGLKGRELDIEQWRDVLEGDFDDEEWEAEMRRRFGDQYYADDEDEEGGDDGTDGEDESKKKNRLKKPKWQDDIDINDLVPDFEKEVPEITLSDDDDDEEQGDAAQQTITSDEEMNGAQPARKKPKTKKDRAKEKSDAKRTARLERRAIEDLVDSTLPLTDPSLAASTNAPPSGFRYRDTSPTSFGLSARDILFADDSQLNQYAGLKKMAAFRDPQKKQKDRKKLSKKARLRQWRKETFGDAEEPGGGFERVLGGGGGGVADGVKKTGADGDGRGIREGERKGKKRKRSKKAKLPEVEA